MNFMDGAKLKTAVLGLNDSGRFLLDIAQKSGYFQIQAVADKNPEVVQAVAREYPCAAYDDYRQLITQNQFDCLLVAASAHSCDEYLRMAMKKKFNILKMTPPARNFEEAMQFVRLAEEENVKFAVATCWRFAESFLALQQFLNQKIFEPYLVTAACTTVREKTEPWQTDRQSAGGGVLLYDCYEIIDRIVINFGIPQKVYAIVSSTAADKQQRLYLTENTAAVTMKFSDTLFVTLLASNVFGPSVKELRLYGKDRLVTINDNELLISSPTGVKNETLKYKDNTRIRTGKLLENFALSVLSAENTKLKISGKENLRNMAVIEAAYLSTKTGFPEEPMRILEMQKFRL